MQRLGGEKVYFPPFAKDAKDGAPVWPWRVEENRQRQGQLLRDDESVLKMRRPIISLLLRVGKKAGIPNRRIFPSLPGMHLNLMAGGISSGGLFGIIPPGYGELER